MCVGTCIDMCRPRAADMRAGRWMPSSLICHTSILCLRRGNVDWLLLADTRRCCDCTFTALSLHSLCTVTVQSLTVPSLYRHCAVAVQSLCSHFTVTVQSPCKNSTVTAQLQLLHSHRTVTVRSPYGRLVAAAALTLQRQ